MVEFKGTSPNAVDVARIEEFEGFGELTVGGSGDNWRIVMISLVLLDNPRLNQFLLANKLKLSDRITKTKIFPRDGMSLPGGEVYQSPSEEVLETAETITEK
jgi:hypothetical protein